MYGDMGNVIAMQFRLKEYGFEHVVYQPVEPGQDLPEHTDWYFIGGGQDKEQEVVYEDFLTKGKQICDDIMLGVGLLSICGGYQLLGQSFLTGNGKQLKGVGLFDITTVAPSSSTQDRCIGNIVTSCNIPELKGEKLIGFENHGGQTFFVENSKTESVQKGNIHEKCYPLAQVLVGKGNNATQAHEGCVLNGAVGTYLHGSLLPKNPALTDWFIRGILEKKQLTLPHSIGSEIEEAVRGQLLKRFV
jgi:lipid II isoglutaminyl synthase (glutamine-hydrolysing)